MLSMVEYVHERMKTYNKHQIGVDFTMGQGHDTLFLSELCDEVYAFDIQEAALEATKKRVANHDHVHLYLESHEHFDKYVEHFDLGVFNLGYLPDFDHTIKTTLESSKNAITKAVAAMNQALFIVCYIGHEEGAQEAAWIDQFVSQLDSHAYNVSMYKMLNKNKAPYVIEIEKR
jgi:methylase of polypeptide subunit release factors